MIYLELFLGFLKVGCFSFGGAYAAIPLIRDVVLEYGWLDEEMVTYMIAVSESTPGPLMVNMATYIGAAKGGILGALIATLTVAFPAFLIIIIVTALMAKVMGNKYVQSTLDGVKASVIGVILTTGLWLIIGNVGLVSQNTKASMSKGAETAGFDIRAVVITAVLGVVYIGVNRILKKKKKKTISPLILIAAAAVIGVVVYGVDWSVIV